MPDVCQEGEDRPRALFISYDGLLEPSGKSQVVPYMCALADGGVDTRILSFEKPDGLSDRDHIDELRTRLSVRGIEWKALPRHRRPRVVGTTLDVVRGLGAAIQIARARRPHVVHARSYVAGLIGWVVKALFRARFVFDMRGFWPEERVELGHYRPQGILYRLSKRLELLLLGASDHVVVLTEKARAILRDREASARLDARPVREKQITVIPCCADLGRFRPRRPDEQLAREHGLVDKLVIGNVGAVNKRYMLPEMFRFAFHVKSHLPETRFVYLTRHDASLLRAMARDAGLAEEDVLIRSVEPEDVPRWMSLFRLGVFFLRPSYAAKASGYTKLAEFLASGVPVVTNTGVGDVDVLLGSNQCGILVPGLREGDLAAAARGSLSLLVGESVPEPVSESCRNVATKHLALDEAARRYLSIYKSLAFPGTEEQAAPVAMGVG